MKHLKYLLILSILMSLVFALQGQTHYSRHYDIFPNSDDLAQDAVEYNDRLFLVFQDIKEQDSIISMMISELDETGEILWMKEFPDDHVLWESPMFIENDTIYLFSYNRPISNLLTLRKLSLAAEILEEISIPVSKLNAESFIPIGVLQESFEGGIILNGSLMKGAGDSLELFNFVAKLGFNGTVDTVVTFETPRGGSMEEVVFDHNTNTLHGLEDAKVWKTTAGGTFPATQLNLYSFDASLNVIDEWNSEMIISPGVGPLSLEILSDGQLIIGGAFESNDYSDLWTINKDGEREFIFRFKHAFSPVVKIVDLAITINNEIVVTGYLPYRPEVTGIDSERLPYLGLFSKNGELLWERLFYYDDAFEQQENGFFQLNEVLADGSIFVGGSNDLHFEDDNNIIRSQREMWLAKVDKDGCIEGECDYRIVDVSEIEFGLNPVIKVFPNPTTNFLNIDVPVDIQLDRIQLFDNFGNLQLMKSGSEKILDCSNLSSGIYNIIAIDSEGNKYHEKFVKI